MKIDLNKRYTYTSETPTITNEGKNEIISYLRRNGFASEHVDSWALRYFDWRLRDERGVKIATRIKKYLIKAGFCEPNESIKAEIGQIARRNVFDVNYTFEFRKEIDWVAGDYGDHKSCFWQNEGQESAKLMLIHYGFYNVRFWDATTGEGRGRAWVYPIPNKEALIIFNGYGLQAREIAGVIAAHFGKSYKKIGLTNCGQWKGILWINEGKAFIIGDHSFIDTVDRWDLQLKDPQTCAGTGRLIWEDTTGIFLNGRWYDKEWAKNHAFTCRTCKNLYIGDEYIRQVRDENDEVVTTLCAKCVREAVSKGSMFICAYSQNIYVADAVGLDLSNGFMIAKPYADLFFQCDICHRYRKIANHMDNQTLNELGVHRCVACANAERRKEQLASLDGIDSAMTDISGSVAKTLSDLRISFQDFAEILRRQNNQE